MQRRVVGWHVEQADLPFGSDSSDRVYASRSVELEPQRPRPVEGEAEELVRRPGGRILGDLAAARVKYTKTVSALLGEPHLAVADRDRDRSGSPVGRIGRGEVFLDRSVVGDAADRAVRELGEVHRSAPLCDVDRLAIA